MDRIQRTWHANACRIFLIGLSSTFFACDTLFAVEDELERVKVEAPADMARLSGGLGGTYYVDQALLQRRDALRERLQILKTEIESGTPSSGSALRELEELEQQSKELREAIDAAKTFVAAFKVFKTTEELHFPLAESKRVIVVGDNVTLRSWEGPGIKCVLEKTILAKDQPSSDEFAAIKMIHTVAVTDELVGRTAEQLAADEKAFNESAQGKAMTEEERKARSEWVNGLISGRYDQFSDFQGIATNNLSVEGLSHQEGNRSLVFRINSPGGGNSLSIEWKRHASVTIFLPKCEHVLVAGCGVQLDIEGLDANLMLTNRRSRDRDLQGSFVVRSIRGNVVIEQAPVRILEDIQGNVSFLETNGSVNSETQYSSSQRVAFTSQMATTEISRVKGDLDCWFLGTQLVLNEIEGALDIRNDFGSTELRLNEATKIDQPMRIISQSANIVVRGSAAVLQKMPIYAFTQIGVLRTNLADGVLENFNFSTGTPQRSWRGFVTPSDDRFSLGRFNRPQDAIDNKERSEGLDLISHAGRVEVLTNDDQPE